MSTLFSLNGKTAVVTGCATGLGQGIVRGLAKAGSDIVMLDIAETEAIVEEVRNLGCQCWSYQIDLSDSRQIRILWERILNETGKIDILVNNAGMQYREQAVDYPEEVFDKVMAVNLKAPYLLSQLAAAHYIERGCRGKIINTASLFTTFGGVNVSGYTCSKHGIMGMTKAMSNELAPYGICVNAIAPGYIATELTKSIWSDSEKRKPIDVRIPAGRWGNPEDFEGVAVFLASEQSDYITGVMIPVDGGYSVR